MICDFVGALRCQIVAIPICDLGIYDQVQGGVSPEPLRYLNERQITHLTGAQPVLDSRKRFLYLDIPCGDYMLYVQKHMQLL